MLPCSEYPEMGPKVEVRRNSRPCVGNARDQVASGWIRKGLTCDDMCIEKFVVCLYKINILSMLFVTCHS